MTKRYLGNSNTMKVHDLHNQKVNCQIGEIRPEHRVYFDTLAAAILAGYSRCDECLDNR